MPKYESQVRPAYFGFIGSKPNLRRSYLVEIETRDLVNIRFLRTICPIDWTMPRQYGLLVLLGNGPTNGGNMARTYRKVLGTEWYGSPRLVISVDRKRGVTITNDLGWKETYKEYLRAERNRRQRAETRKIRHNYGEGV